MKPIKHTAAPHLNQNYTAVPVDIEVKTTEGKVVTRYFAKEDVTMPEAYGTFTCKAGDEIFGRYTAKGLINCDGYGMIFREAIAWDKIETKHFMKVTERITTTWEVIEK